MRHRVLVVGISAIVAVGMLPTIAQAYPPGSAHQSANAAVLAARKKAKGTLKVSADGVITPCGGDRVIELAVTGDYWYAACSSQPSARAVLSRDAGATWQSIPDFVSFMPVAADGFFYDYMGFVWGGGFTVDRLDGATSVVTRVRFAGPDPGAGPWVADEERRLAWAYSCDDSRVARLVRLDLTSATSTLAATGVGCTPQNEDEYQEPLRLDGSGQPYIVASPTTRWVVQGSALTLATLPALAESGDTRITEGGITSGGRTKTQEFSSVPGHPDVLASGKLYLPVGEGIWWGADRGFLASSSQGPVTTTDWRATSIQVIPDALVEHLKPVGDSQSADSAEMIDETNRMRAEVGLLPLVGDSRLAAAAHNHAVYMQLNGVIGHGEDSTKPGFTGNEPWERCVATGFTEQCGEIAAMSGGRASVQLWIATAFHRSLLMSPGLSQIGGGFVMPGGWSAMNAPSSSLHFLGDPVGYPQGTYTGPLWFAGEIPDPATYCPDGSISAPYGTAISLNLPENNFERPDSIMVRDPSGNLVPGCLLHDRMSGVVVYQPDDALKPWTTYSVTATWNGRREDLAWKFTTTAGPAGFDSAPPDSTSPNRRDHRKRFAVMVKKRHHRAIRLDVNPDIGKRVYRVQIQKRKKTSWRSVRAIRITGKHHVKMVHVRKPGAYRVVVPAQLNLRRGLSRTFRIA